MCGNKTFLLKTNYKKVQFWPSAVHETIKVHWIQSTYDVLTGFSLHTNSTIRNSSWAIPFLWELNWFKSKTRFSLDWGSISPPCLCTAFKHKDPKSVKIQSSCQYIFVLLGSTGIKALCKMLMKLILGNGALNFQRSHFTLRTCIICVWQRTCVCSYVCVWKRACSY